MAILLELDDDGGRVQAIRRDFVQHGVDKCCLQALQYWLWGQGKKPLTWATLTAVLRDMECNSLARDIEEEFAGET